MAPSSRASSELSLNPASASDHDGGGGNGVSHSDSTNNGARSPNFTVDVSQSIVQGWAAGLRLSFVDEKLGFTPLLLCPFCQISSCPGAMESTEQYTGNYKLVSET